MKLLRFEILKLLKSQAIFGFIVICLIFNLIIVFSSSKKEEIDYLNRVAEITGTVYGEEYAERLQTVTIPEEEVHPDFGLYNYLVAGSSQAHNTFAKWDNVAIQKKLTSYQTRLSNTAKGILSWKYEKIVPIIEEKAARDDSSSVYFGVVTSAIQTSIIDNLSKLVAIESSIFFILIVLWALGYECMAKTSLVTFSCKTGRKLAFYKIISALLIGTAFFALNYCITYGFAFAINDFSVVWCQNVSAQYHAIHDRFLGDMPFATWNNLTVGGYFFASVGASFLNALAAGLFAIPFGLMIKNVYTAFCSIAGMFFLNLIIFVMGLQTAETVPFLWHLSLVTPIMQILSNSAWFSDGGTSMLLPHFELLYPLICILFAAIAIAVCGIKFTRKEIA